MTYLMAERVPARWGLAALFDAGMPVVVLAWCWPPPRRIPRRSHEAGEEWFESEI